MHIIDIFRGLLSLHVDPEQQNIQVGLPAVHACVHEDGDAHPFEVKPVALSTLVWHVCRSLMIHIKFCVHFVDTFKCRNILVLAEPHIVAMDIDIESYKECIHSYTY